MMGPGKLLKQIDELKREIDAFRPLNKHQLAQLKEYYRIGLTYSSNALEGNSLTEVETKIVIEEGITIGGKPLKDHYEAIGHSKAFDQLYELAKGDTITENDILTLHQFFYQTVDEKKAGKYRREQVIITGSEFIPPAADKVPSLMAAFTGQIAAQREKLHPVEFAAWLHLELVTIHPFVDGNGRTARLLMNLALLQGGYMITIIPPVVRNTYIETLQAAQVKKDKQPFYDFISAMVYESAKDYLRLVRSL